MVVDELEDNVRRVICFVCDGVEKHKEHLSREGVEEKFQRFRDISVNFLCSKALFSRV